jgi:methyl-accepting chemotaxis protein
LNQYAARDDIFFRRGVYDKHFEAKAQGRKSSPSATRSEREKKRQGAQAKIILSGQHQNRAKLLAAFLLVALLGGAMGLYAVFNLKALNESAQELHVNVLLPTKNLTSMVKAFYSQQVMLRQMLISEDDLHRTVYISNIKTADNTITSSLTLLRTLITDDGKEAFEKLNTDYAAYYEYLTKATDLIASGDKDTLRKWLLYGELHDLESALEDSFNDMIYTVSGNASAASTENNNTARNAFLITLIGVGAVLLLSAGIGILMALGVSRPIRKLTEGANHLAAGNIDFDIHGASGKDEIGQIREAFKKILAVIRDMTQDTDMLITAAALGELSVRADAEKHTGAYRKIVQGFNSTLDAAVTPMVEAAGALTELANGNLNVSVEGDFKGDFAIVKNAFNTTVESLKAYIGEINSVMESVASGSLT